MKFPIVLLSAMLFISGCATLQETGGITQQPPYTPLHEKDVASLRTYYSTDTLIIRDTYVGYATTVPLKRVEILRPYTILEKWDGKHKRYYALDSQQDLSGAQCLQKA
ncbi:hypothetical protein [Chitinophaga pinensis]|uniref:Uncharacterized protein n=1 Tax=Chitinophaga pinensis TaxID=79329 RepID=A0A5C6LVK2_9BACT|nr:hypothetical protein [Chitinophaga pinensis]TWW00608.1 hypothetical protein FEF09_11235 [Chitinophaga pinensis]